MISAAGLFLYSLLGSTAAVTICLPTTVTVTVTAGAPTSTTSSAGTTCATPTPVAGYVADWSCQSAAADGAGYVSSFTTTAIDVSGCAAACSSTSACNFFNVYTESLGGSMTGGVCVLWNQAKPLSSATNSGNNGKPITDSAGFSKGARVETSTTTTSAVASSTSTVSVPVQTAGPISGYSLEWSGKNAAANCAGYLASGVSNSWSIEACASQCNSNSACSFFNVYQQSVSGAYNYVCVLWNQDQPFEQCGTNVWNNGLPISSSAGYVKNPVVGGSSSSTATTTSSSSSTTSATSTAPKTTSTTTTSTSSTPSSTSTTSRSSTLSTSTRSTTTTMPTTTSSTTKTTSTTTTSASVCPNGTPVPTQCAGQNQFTVRAFFQGNSTPYYLTWTSGTIKTTTDKTAATAFYFNEAIGRLRTCPCAGVPSYRIPPTDVLNTDGFFMKLSNGLVDKSVISVQDAKTGNGAYWRQFDAGDLGITAESTTSDPTAGAIVALAITMITV